MNQTANETAEAQLGKARRRKFPIPVALNVMLWLLIQTVIVLCWLLPVWAADHLLAILLFAFIYGAVSQPLYALLHEAMHDIFSRNRLLNDSAGFTLSVWMFSSFHLLRLVHLGHHVSNRSRRERIEYYDDNGSRWQQALFYYAVLLGLNWVGFVLQNLLFLLLPTALIRRLGLDRNLGATLPPMKDRDLRRIRLEFGATLLVYAAILWLTPVSGLQLACFLFANAMFYSQIRYIYHYKAKFDVVEGAYDLKAPHWLQWFLLNSNYHLTHHRNPKVPWLYAPRVAAPGSMQYSVAYKLKEQWRGVLPESSQPEREGRTITWNGDSMLAVFNGTEE